MNLEHLTFTDVAMMVLFAAALACAAYADWKRERKGGGR